MNKLTNFVLAVSMLCLALSCTDYDIRKDGVYYESWNEARGKTETLVENADKTTFEKIDNNYGKDQYHVFYKAEVVLGADPQSFELVENGYATDKYRAYYYGAPIENSSSKGFEILDSYFSKDQKDVFYRTKSLGVQDLTAFTFLTNNNLNDRWSTDGNYYWFNNFKVPSTNYEDIVLLDSTAGFSRDNKTIYFLDRDLRYNSAGERILDTLDLETFVIERRIECRDKFGCINIFHGRVHCD